MQFRSFCNFINYNEFIIGLQNVQQVHSWSMFIFLIFVSKGLDKIPLILAFQKCKQTVAEFFSSC